MTGKFQEDSEGKEWVDRYENMLASKSPVFLDLDAWEYVIFHYVKSEQPTKARVACEMAMETYPFSADLLLDYAHVLANCGENATAMEVITKAEAFFSQRHRPHSFKMYFIKL